MAKKQTRRSISVSRNTYERLRAYCETNSISMSQFVERRVGDYLGRTDIPQVTISAPVSSAREQTRVQPIAKAAVPVVKEVTTSSPTPAAPADVVVPRQVRNSASGPVLKDPDIKLTADQIFTF